MNLKDESQPDESQQTDLPSFAARATGFLRTFRTEISLLAVIVLFILYVDRLSTNPPGFYVDESGLAYNAYSIAHTGAGESGERFPLFFQFYTNDFTQWANPTQIYLLSVPFLVFQPSIWKARVFSAAWVFAACLLLGFLARRISGQRRIGAIVALLALLTPWLFEVSRLVLETFFYPMAVVLFLLAVHYAQQKQKWSWVNIATIAMTLMLLTYSYTIGRVLGPLLAFGLLLFATTKQRLRGVIKTWLAYGVTLIPLMIFKVRHPGILTQRFYQISYIKPDSPWREIITSFIKRYAEDFSLRRLLIDGDINALAHVPHSLGSFLIATFILAIMGLIIVVVRQWREPWWRFVISGTAASVVPGSLTADPFHTLRMIAYPIFLLVLTIPALNFLFTVRQVKTDSPGAIENQTSLSGWAHRARRVVLVVLLIGAAAQAVFFQSVFRREGPSRKSNFDAEYKDVYDAAVTQPDRPIYLIDGGAGPMYVHGYWYAVVEGRNPAEFIHLNYGQRAPAGALVISSDPECVNCQIIRSAGGLLCYRAL
jgi:4-amino-4-deoxy-L-arabinose transferase-like glycosyltransferase